jgi:hypothetical protein
MLEVLEKPLRDAATQEALVKLRDKAADDGAGRMTRPTSRT